MDRKLALNAQVAIAQGHRVEVTERTDSLTGEQVVLGIVDLDSGIRYRRTEEPHGEVSRWLGRVRECTVVIGGSGVHTQLIVDRVGPGAGEATVALHGADAAADAAKAEADRWGGSDRTQQEEPERFW